MVKHGNKKKDEEQAYLRSIKDGVKWFAWYPVKLDDGNWAWLEWVKKDYFVYDYDGKLKQCFDEPVYYLWEGK